MKIYETIKNTMEQEVKNECDKFRLETSEEFKSSSISSMQFEIMIATINQLEKRILGRL